MLFLQIISNLKDTLKVVCINDSHKSSENYWYNNSLVGLLIGGIIGGIITIICTTILEKRKKSRDDKEFREKKLGFFSLFIIGSIEYCDNLILLIKYIITKIESNPDDFHFMSFKENVDIEIISNNINLEDTFHAFATQAKPNPDVNRFYNLYTIIAGLNKLIKEMASVYNMGEDRDYKKREEYKTLYISTIEIMNSCLVDKSLSNEPEFVKTISINLNKLNSDFSLYSQITWLEANFVEILKKEIAQKFTHIPKAIQILFKLENMTDYYTTILERQESLQKYLCEILKRLEEDTVKLKANRI